MAPGAPGGMVEFRRSLAASFLFKFFVGVASSRHAAAAAAASPTSAAASSPSPPLLPLYTSPFDAREASAAQPLGANRAPPRGLQYSTRSPGAPFPVGAPLMHASAELQSTGEAIYIDDIPTPPRMLHAAFVRSDKPHATLLSLDPTAGDAIPGFVKFFGANDVPGDNAFGPVIQDEPLFVAVGGELTCVGQPMGMIVADTEARDWPIHSPLKIHLFMIISHPYLTRVRTRSPPRRRRGPRRGRWPPPQRTPTCRRY